MRKALSAGKRGNRVVTMLELLFVMTAAAISASGQETNIKDTLLPSGNYMIKRSPEGESL